MAYYDVIVVGAGPAGSGAAKAAAERGAKTIILEEHSKIGLPQHCSGLYYGTGSGSGEKILATMDKRVVIDEVKVRRLYSPKERLFEIPLEGKGVYLIDRALFDMQLAGQAAEKGAEILVNTKITGLLNHGDETYGVTTSSKSMPEIRGKVVIAADGIKSLLGGIPVWSGLTEKANMINSGVTILLFNVRDIDRGVQELHIGAYGSNRTNIGWIWLHRIDQYTCLSGFDSLEDFERCKQGNSLLAKKLRDAVPGRMNAFAQAMLGEKSLPQKVKPGLILAGAAANFNTFQLCHISGMYAGEVAAEAVKENNVSEERLSAYNALSSRLDDPEMGTGFGFGSFVGLTEEEQEETFDRMIKSDHVNFDFLNHI